MTDLKTENHITNIHVSESIPCYLRRPKTFDFS